MKLKTHKATAKRIKITKRKKYLHRKTHQDHFNARDPGKKTRAKRRLKRVHITSRQQIKRLLPYG